MFQKSSDEVVPQHGAGGEHDEVETVVGPSVNVEGDFASEGNILVKGTVSGSVKTSKRLTVEDGAKIFANVSAGSAVISGEVRGNVSAADMLELRATARVMGDVECKVLVVEAGCLIHGRVEMAGLSGEADRGEKKRSFPRQRTRLASEEPEEGVDVQ